MQNVVMHAPMHDFVEGKPKHLPDTHLAKASEGSRTPGIAGCSLKTKKVGHVNLRVLPSIK